MLKRETIRKAASESTKYDIPVYLYEKPGGGCVVAPSMPEGYYQPTLERVPVWRGELYVSKWIVSKLKGV